MDAEEVASLQQQATQTPAEIDLVRLSEYVALPVERKQRLIDAIDGNSTDIVDEFDEISDADAVKTLVRRCTVCDRDDVAYPGATEVFRRLVIYSPQPVATALSEWLSDSNPTYRSRAVSGYKGIAKRNPTLLLPHISELIERVGERDPRIAAQAVDVLALIATEHPERSTEAVAPARRFLSDSWVPDATKSSPSYLYAQNAPDAGYDPPLDSGIGQPWPMQQTLSLLANVAQHRPEAIDPVRGRVIELLSVIDRRAWSHVDPLFETITGIARTHPEALKTAIPVLEDWAAGDDVSGRDLQAVNVLCELGRDVGTDERVEFGEFKPRTVETDADDLERAHEIEHSSDVSAGEVLRLLHSTDSEVRDQAANGLMVNVGLPEHGDPTLGEQVHERAGEFLALLQEPNGCVRQHLHEALGEIAQQYPRQWLPALFDLAEHGSARAREGALRIIHSVAQETPCLVQNEVDSVMKHSDAQEQKVCAATLDVLTELAGAYPRQHVERAPWVASMLDETLSVKFAACKWMAALAASEPYALVPFVDGMHDVLRASLGPERIDDRVVARFPAGGFTSEDYIVRVATTAVFRIARSEPSVVDPVRADLERAVDHQVWGWQMALNALTVAEVD